jgi:pentatricopeptide repeat protein
LYILFSIIGKLEDAKKVAQKVSERLEDEASKITINKEKHLPIIQFNLNKIIANLPDYSSAIKILESMRALKYNTLTYNTLINKAPNYNIAREKYDEMMAQDIQPDVVTYNILIKKASNYNIAKVLFDEMMAQDIQPNVITYNTILKKSS